MPRRRGHPRRLCRRDGRRHRRSAQVIHATAACARFPRRDGGEEINARITVSGWPILDLRTRSAARLAVEGTLASASLRLHGLYTALLGDGDMRSSTGPPGRSVSTARAAISYSTARDSTSTGFR